MVALASSTSCISLSNPPTFCPTLQHQSTFQPVPFQFDLLIPSIALCGEGACLSEMGAECGGLCPRFLPHSPKLQHQRPLICDTLEILNKGPWLHSGMLSESHTDGMRLTEKQPIFSLVSIKLCRRPISVGMATRYGLERCNCSVPFVY